MINAKFKSIPLTTVNSKDYLPKFKLVANQEYRIHVFPELSQSSIDIHYVKGLGYLACNSTPTHIAPCCLKLNGSTETKRKTYFPMIILQYRVASSKLEEDEIHPAMLDAKSVFFWLCPRTRRDMIAKALEMSGKPLEQQDLILSCQATNSFNATPPQDGLCIKDAKVMEKRFNLAKEEAVKMFNDLEKKSGIKFMTNEELEGAIARFMETVSIDDIVPDSAMQNSNFKPAAASPAAASKPKPTQKSAPPPVETPSSASGMDESEIDDFLNG